MFPNQQNFGQPFPNQNLYSANLSPEEYANKVQNIHDQFTAPSGFSFNQSIPTHFSQTNVRNPLFQAAHPTFNLRKENYIHEFNLEDENDTQDLIATIQEDPRQPQEDKKEDDPEAIQKEQKRIGSAFTFFKKRNGNFTEFLLLMTDLEMSGDKFIDKDFPPAIESLIGRNKQREIEWRNFVWLRPDEFYGENRYEVFQGELKTSKINRLYTSSAIDPNDIHQGLLGDCYFLSTLSSLAEFPERIHKLFATTAVNTVGCYCIKVCEMGEWKKVIIDDYFPCDPVKRKPVFTTGEHELWVLILEKAWAKIYGSYDAIESGLTRECLRDLTGAPTKFFLTNKRDQWEHIWGKLLKGEAKHYVMTCGANSPTDSDEVNPLTEVGLVLGHAYSLLAAYEVELDGEKVRLVKLRNPWGYAEWNGDWSDESPKWTEELREKLQVKDKNDGVFYMEYEDFLKNFDSIQFCYVHDDYEYVSHRVSSDPNHAVYFKIKVEKEGKYYITINQESKRKNTHNPNFEYSSASLVVGRILENGDYEYATSTNGADKEVWVKSLLTPGEYVVYAKVKWVTTKNMDFVLSVYGPGKTGVEVVKKDPQFLEKTFITKARQSEKKASLNQADCFRVFEKSKDGFVYFYYQNLSNKAFMADVYFKDFFGVKLRKPFRGDKFKVIVPAQQEKIVLLRILPKQVGKLAIDEKIEVLASQTEVNDAIQAIKDEAEGKVKKVVTVPNLDAQAKRDGEMRRVKDSVTKDFLNMRIYNYQHDDGVYLFFENLTKDVTLDQKVGYELQGLEPIGFSGANEIQFELKPGATYRLAFRKIAEPGEAVFTYDSRGRK